MDERTIRALASLAMGAAVQNRFWLEWDELAKERPPIATAAQRRELVLRAKRAVKAWLDDLAEQVQAEHGPTPLIGELLNEVDRWTEKVRERRPVSVVPEPE